jgi:acetylornithine/N-succinyldiaminopimelate aminotransferase
MDDSPMQLSDFPLNALMEITARPPLVFLRGEGAWIHDHEGRKYLDFVQGWAVNCLGHSPRVVADALAAQAGTLITPGPGLWNAPSARLAQRLVRHSCFDRVFFTSSGAEANEGAIKLARKWGAKFKHGAYEIITFDHAFHGRTLATMAASGKAGWDKLFEPKVPGFPKATLNDLASVERLVSDRTVAVMLEPIQGEAGVLPATDAFLQALRELTRARGLLLILDEIQTGIGRTGKLFAYEHAAIEPDIMTVGKGIGAGVPLGALLAKQAVCCFEHGDQGGTYNGNPLMTAVGGAVVDVVLAPGFLDGVGERGRQLAGGLSQLAGKHRLGEVRGRGLLLALDLGREVGAKVVDAARERGLLINSPRPESLRFMPALTTSSTEIDLMLGLLDDALGSTLGR